MIFPSNQLWFYDFTLTPPSLSLSVVADPRVTALRQLEAAATETDSVRTEDFESAFQKVAVPLPAGTLVRNPFPLDPPVHSPFLLSFISNHL